MSCRNTASGSVYVNKSRSSYGGSQSESSSLIFKDGMYQVRGYQSFDINEKNMVIKSEYRKKYEWIKEFIKKTNSEKKEGERINTMTDIGACVGLSGFLCRNINFLERVYCLERDLQYVYHCNKLIEELGVKNMKCMRYSFGDPHVKTDLVVMFALIHWIFSCTALYGSFDPIFEYVSSITNKYLVIEWVDPKDRAISYFKHTSHNKDIVKEEYCKCNFEKSLNKYFRVVRKELDVTPTRLLYICSK